MYQQRDYCLFSDVSYFNDWRKFRFYHQKRSVGLPVVIAIIIFYCFYVMNFDRRKYYLKEKNPLFRAWLSNLVLFPFGVWLTYKALTDSQVFDVEKYKASDQASLEQICERKRTRTLSIILEF